MSLENIYGEKVKELEVSCPKCQELGTLCYEDPHDVKITDNKAIKMVRRIAGCIGVIMLFGIIYSIHIFLTIGVMK